MNNQRPSKVSLIAMPLVIACCLLASGAPAQAQWQNSSNLFQSFGQGSCSNKTIKGDYGCSIQGSLILGTTQLPFVAATATHYDGDGNLTGLEHVVVNGSSFDSGWDKNAGTYAVNPDCTGESVTSSPNSQDPIINYFVVVDNGKQIYSVNGQHALSIMCTRVK
ncbi:MAG: hypothetical protein WA869_36420 [Alloacidobacterium sp.]